MKPLRISIIWPCFFEQCDLLCMTLDNAKELEKKVTAFRQMMNRLDERNIMANERRLTAAISFTAEKRYKEFVDCYPALAANFHEHLVAS